MVTDRFSKMVHLIPFGDDTTAETMARRFYAEVVRLHGLPSSIISDRDPRWMSTFWTDLFHLMGVELKRSTAFHPETDGQSERSIRTVCEMLRAHAVAKSIEWLTVSQQLNCTTMPLCNIALESHLLRSYMVGRLSYHWTSLFLLILQPSRLLPCGQKQSRPLNEHK